MINESGIVSIDDTESYDNVIPGPLRLKGNVQNSVINKRRKIKSSVSTDYQTMYNNNNDNNRNEEANIDQIMDREDDFVAHRGKTEAELRFELMRMEREKKEIERLAQKSYRERVDEYNKKIANESEHHDIPKVGPG